jgi:septal ring factor EnvC (AmiA/AmiB activator)
VLALMLSDEGTQRMTIEAWTLLFSAITSGLVLVGGVWLKHVVNQQLKSKDTTIETLNAAIKLHEAEIAALKNDRAPAIATEYKTMREHADRMTADKQALDEQIKKLTESQKEGEKVQQLIKAMSEIDGLTLASNLLTEAFDRYISGMKISPANRVEQDSLLQDFMLDILDVVSGIGKEVETRNMDVKRVLDNDLIYVPLDEGYKRPQPD